MSQATTVASSIVTNLIDTGLDFTALGDNLDTVIESVAAHFEYMQGVIETAAENNPNAISAIFYSISEHDTVLNETALNNISTILKQYDASYDDIIENLTELNTALGTIIATSIDTELVDSDGDLWPDSVDAFPDDETEQFDSGEDGIGDYADAYPLNPDKSVYIDELTASFEDLLDSLSYINVQNKVVKINLSNVSNCSEGHLNLQYDMTLFFEFTPSDNMYKLTTYVCSYDDIDQDSVDELICYPYQEFIINYENGIQTSIEFVMDPTNLVFELPFDFQSKYFRTTEQGLTYSGTIQAEDIVDIEVEGTVIKSIKFKVEIEEEYGVNDFYVYFNPEYGFDGIGIDENCFDYAEEIIQDYYSTPYTMDEFVESSDDIIMDANRNGIDDNCEDEDSSTICIGSDEDSGSHTIIISD